MLQCVYAKTNWKLSNIFSLLNGNKRQLYLKRRTDNVKRYVLFFLKQSTHLYRLINVTYDLITSLIILYFSTFLILNKYIKADDTSFGFEVIAEETSQC